MRKLTFGMNLSLDGYIAAAGDDLGWSVPSDELFQWWSHRVGATGLALYGRKLWETMSSHGPTADPQPGPSSARPHATGNAFPPPLAGHAEGGVLLDDQRGRLERPPGHRRRGHRDHPAQDRGWRSHGRRRRHPRRGGHAGRADRRVRARHPPGPGGRWHAVLHDPGRLGEPDPGGDPDVPRRRAPDQIRDQALSARHRIGAGSAVALNGPLWDT